MIDPVAVAQFTGLLAVALAMEGIGLTFTLIGTRELSQLELPDT